MNQKNKRAFLRMALGTLGASLSRNLLSSKSTSRAGEGTIRTAQDFNATSSFNKFWKKKVIWT